MITVPKHGIQKLKNSHTKFKGSTDDDWMNNLYTLILYTFRLYLLLMSFLFSMLIKTWNTFQKYIFFF